MKTRSLSLTLLLLTVCGVLGADELRTWGVFELPLTSEKEPENPYVEGLPDGGPALVRATFTNKELKHTVAGFWDGGTSWKVRFAPPAPGEWSYETVSSDKGLDGARGSFTCRAASDDEKQSNPSLRGVIHVAEGGRYFEYADGTPFLWIGDTWWNWSKRGILLPTFQKLADDRAAKGFTVGQLFLAGNGGMFDRGFSRPDVEQLRRVEQFVTYANSKGIAVWLHPWWSRKDLDKTVGAEKIRRFWRYTIHRFGAYNVIWVLAGEYNMHNYGGFGLDFWKELGTLVRHEDPYGRMIGTHPTPPFWDGGADAPQWSTGEVVHAEPWLDFNQSQVGHGKWRNEMIPRVIAADYARTPAKPTVVTEPWYEFVEGSPPAEDVRFAAWSAILSGAAGHTYGGGHVWWAHVPEAPTRQGTWPLEEGFERNTLDYPGAVSIGFLATFLKAIPWWTLTPHPELLSETAQPLCTADPGKRYVIYLRWGGGVSVDLRLSSESDRFEYTWIDLTQNKERKHGTTTGGAVRRFQAPEDYPGVRQYKDWVLHIARP